jgi:sugar transferase (PEP-CTERM/EpsH1 system associated)
MAQYALETRRSRILVDFVDVDSEKWAAYAATKRFPFRQIYGREACQLLRFDRAVAAKANTSIFVSEAEADLFRVRAPESREKVVAISNGVDFTYFSPENAGEKPHFPEGPNIVFTGQMDYWPNVDAVVWFSDSVLPTIREKFPGATFYIVGAHPSAAVQALASRPGIVVTGRVSDVRPYIAHADVVVAPLRIGRGIQNKVLEGMAMARPVVATPQALEGIDARPGSHVLLAKDIDGFISCVERILDPLLAKAVGVAARERVLQRYDWSNSLAKYDRLLRSRST